MIHIRKKKELFVVEVVSPVNGKTLTTGRPVSQKISVSTQINATAKEFGANVGAKVEVFDETLQEPKLSTYKVI